MITPSLAFVLITVMINMMGVGLVWPILPNLVEELTGLPVSQTAQIYGWTVVSFSLMQFLFAPLAGHLSDRFGRRPIMLIALVGMFLDNLLLALAPSIEWMFAGRILGGIFGATFVVANAYVADTTKPEKRAAGFGLIGAAFGIGFIIGPLAGGYLGEYDLRLPFQMAAGLSLTNAIFGFFVLRETLLPAKRSVFTPSRANPFRSFAWLFKYPGMIFLGIAIMLAQAMQRGLESVWVLFTEYQYGWGSSEAGISLALVGVSYLFVQGWLVGKVVAWLGETATMVGGFLLAGAMYLWLSVNTIGIFGYLGIIPYVIGWGCAQPALQAIASRQVSQSQQGQLQGTLMALGGLASIVGPLMATRSFAFFTSQDAPLIFPGAFFLLGAVLLGVSAVLGLYGGRNTLKS